MSRPALRAAAIDQDETIKPAGEGRDDGATRPLTPADGAAADPDATLPATPPSDPDATIASTPNVPESRRSNSEARIGATIGNYTLREVLGEGGFGAVYLAEQSRPVRRKVAFKVLKLGMDSEQVLSRFEAERQAMALMDHPGIAGVLDAGLTPLGRPYFVMELVRGLPLSKYCDQHKLSTRSRLELFISVCRAVQHAHMKGVVHRDLKPSNILVRTVDDKPAVKIIDFGIAKAVHAPLTEAPAHTMAEQMLGTPQYMSPEQAGGAGVDVDTRADVYSLGVILYELLTGSTPLKAETIMGATLSELPTLLREQPTQRPSQRLATLGADSGDFARTHGGTPEQLRSEMKGDLDWIVLKAVEKERDRRYATPDALADDVERHLRHEPVEASPPSTSYRVKKFVRRNRIGVAAGAAVSLAVVAGAVASSIGFYNASVERDRAVVARSEAETARDEARASLDLILGIITNAEPGEAGRDLTVLEALDQSRFMLEQLADNLKVRASVNKAIGELYLALGQLERADVRLRAALDDATESLGPRSLLALQIRDSMAERLIEAGQLEAARDEAARAVELKREVLGEADAELAVSLRTLGRALTALGESERAEAAYDEALAVQTAALDPNDPDTAATLLELALLNRRSGDYDRAREHLDSALGSLIATVGEMHPDTLRARSDAAFIDYERGAYAEAAGRFEDLIADATETYGETHSRTIELRSRYAATLLELSRNEEAAHEFAQVVELRERMLGADHPDTVKARSDLGLLYRRLGDYGRAREQLAAALDEQRESLGRDHQATVTTAINLSNVYIEMRDYQAALDLMRRTLRDFEAATSPEHPVAINLSVNFGSTLSRVDRLDDAEAFLSTALERAEKVFGKESPTWLAASANLASVYRAQDRYDEAEALYLSTIESQEKVQGRDHFNTLRTANNLAELYRSRGDWSRAVRLHADTLERRIGAVGTDHPDTDRSRVNLVAALESALRKAAR